MKEKKKNKGGRPVKYTDDYVEMINDKLRIYTDITNIPIVVEFCYQNDIRKQRLYEDERFSDSLKRLLEKKESDLERKGLDGNNTMSIFSLKQLGWTDTPEEIKDLPNKITITLPGQFGN